MVELRRPTFIIGGSAAAGTSFLSSILVQHPEIYLPKEMRPEPHYFYKSWEYEKGFDYYLHRWFGEVLAGHVAIGERSSSYLFGGKRVALRIAEDLPNVKLVFVLRDPVERTWANYRYTALEGLEPLSFQEALRREPERIRSQQGVWAEIQPHNYTGRGFYGAQLREYLTVFSSDQILIIKSEDLRLRLDENLRRLYDFLQVDTNFRHKDLPPDFTSLSVRDPWLQTEFRSHFGERFDEVVEALRREVPVANLAKNACDKDKLELLESNLTGEKKEMPQESRLYLKNLFSSDIEILSQLTGLSYTDWAS